MTDFVETQIADGRFTWKVPSRYTQLRFIGQGGSSLFCSAQDSQTFENVAIKKMGRPFNSTKDTCRLLAILHHMCHENVVCLIDLFTPDSSLSSFRDIYLVRHLMGATLDQVIRTNTLTDDHVQYLVYQLLRGLKYLHSAGIIHGNLKPRYLLVNEDCDLRISGFRAVRPDADEDWDDYHFPRFYKAPETVFHLQRSKAMDVWSAGCIMVEMLMGSILFPASDHVDLVNRIVSVLGMPNADFLKKLNPDIVRFMKGMDTPSPKGLQGVLPNASPQAVGFVDTMLKWDAEQRCSVVEALENPYLDRYHDPDDEPEAEVFVNRLKDKKLTDEQWKSHLWNNVQDFVRNFPTSVLVDGS